LVDHVFVMEKGRLVAQGSHEQLLLDNEQDRYRRLLGLTATAANGMPTAYAINNATL
jgi:ABC-type multidrug transport system fused ATPase/permease subunit